MSAYTIEKLIAEFEEFRKEPAFYELPGIKYYSKYGDWFFNTIDLCQNSELRPKVGILQRLALATVRSRRPEQGFWGRLKQRWLVFKLRKELG
jgi:hypothetical protein